jgi:hypothetical protein
LTRNTLAAALPERARFDHFILLAQQIDPFGLQSYSFGASNVDIKHVNYAYSIRQMSKNGKAAPVLDIFDGVFRVGSMGLIAHTCSTNGIFIMPRGDGILIYVNGRPVAEIWHQISHLLLIPVA